MPSLLPVPRSVAPTDNLYKFISLFGLSLLVTSIVLLAIRVTQYNRLVVAAQVEDAVVVEKLFQNVTEMHNAMQQSFPATSNPAPPTSQAATDLTEASQRVLKEANDFKVDSARRRAEIRADKTLLEGNKTDLVLLGGVSLAISALGFVLWYRKLQRPLDKLLEARVTLRLKLIKEHAKAHSAESKSLPKSEPQT